MATAEITAEARERAEHVSRDEASADEHAADEAAYYAGIARKLLYGVQGNEAGGDPAEAHRLLIKAQSYLRSALRLIESEQERLCFDYGLDDGTASADDAAKAQELISIVKAA